MQENSYNVLGLVCVFFPMASCLDSKTYAKLSWRCACQTVPMPVWYLALRALQITFLSMAWTDFQTYSNMSNLLQNLRYTRINAHVTINTAMSDDYRSYKGHDYFLDNNVPLATYASSLCIWNTSFFIERSFWNASIWRHNYVTYN